MKKWEEERKRKQYAEKIINAKPTLKTQPKGAKVLSSQYSNRNSNALYVPDSSEQDVRSQYISADMGSNSNVAGMMSTHYTQINSRLKSNRNEAITIQNTSGGGSTYYKPKLRQSNSNNQGIVQRKQTKSISDFSQNKQR